MSGSKRLSIRAGTVLARNTFDTDLLPLDAIRLDAYCELNGIPLRFLPYRWQPSRSHDGAVTDAVERVYRDRYPARLGGRVTLDHVEKPPTMPIQWAVDVYETEPGGLHDTEDPFIAELYRKMIRDGWTGKEAREQLEYILRRDHNREHRKWLDRKRHTRAWVEAEFKLKYAKAEKRRTKEIVARGQRWIDNSIAQDKSFEAREIAIGVPAIVPVVPKRSFMADVMDGAPEAMPKR